MQVAADPQSKLWTGTLPPYLSYPSTSARFEPILDVEQQPEFVGIVCANSLWDRASGVCRV